jgi:iron complex transport system permease protein
VHGLASRRGVLDVRTLLLAGVVTGSLMASLLSMVLLAAGKDTNDVLRWLMGNTSLATWPKIGMLTASLVIGSAFLVPKSKSLNALALGGDAAHQLGVDVKGLTRVILIAGSAMTAAAVGTVGIIGFLGLVAPHLARRLIGVDWRFSLPGAMLVGSLLLVLSDIVAQRGLSWMTQTPGMDIPVGIITGVLGAPALLILLRKEI